jgi:hypothetical protein
MKRNKQKRKYPFRIRQKILIEGRVVAVMDGCCVVRLKNVLNHPLVVTIPWDIIRKGKVETIEP